MTRGEPSAALAIGRTHAAPFSAVLERIQAALGAEGFGVLTRIDVQATLRQKLGVETPACVILGACHPPLAHRALSARPEVALLLPCNVVVRDLGGGRTRVEAVDPRALLALVPGPEIEAVAAEAGARLGRVIEAVGAA